MKVPTAEEGVELEWRIRQLLHAAGIRLDLQVAGALVSIAIDHFADHPAGPFLEFMADMHATARNAFWAKDLCPTCRCELPKRTRVCEWCP